MYSIIIIQYIILYLFNPINQMTQTFLSFILTCDSFILNIK